MLLRCKSLEPPMSQMGHERPKGHVRVESAVPPIADVMLQCREWSRCARNGLMHRSKQCLYSITSSARASRVAGTSRPSVLAVLRLITISYLVGACTGRSAGFSPLRMRST